MATSPRIAGANVPRAGTPGLQSVSEFGGGVTIVLLLSWLPLPAQAEGPVAIRIDGSVLPGELTGCDVGHQVRLRKGDEHVSVPWSDLACWGRFRDRTQGTQLLLSDGSWLVADVFRIADGRVTIGSRLWRETSIPLKTVSAIVFHFSADSHARDQLRDRLARTVSPHDHLFLENGDELDGQCVLPLAPGAGEFNPTQLRWLPVDAESAAEIPLERVVAIWFNQAGRDAGNTATSAAQAQVGFRDGSLLQVVNMQVVDGVLRVVMATQDAVSTDSSAGSAAGPLQAVAFIQPLNAAAVYLSHCEPLGYKHLPALSLQWPYRTDRSVDGGYLRHGDHVYFKGLGMHSTARLAYTLDRPYRWLVADLAIDQRAGGQGSVVFRVYAQKEQAAWLLAYESPVVRGDQPLVPMRVDLQGVKRIALIVDSADRSDVCDHADWINVRLVP